jgi:hypothetical protein
MHYKIGQLILTPGAKSSTTCELFVAQPDSDKEELVGKLFVLVEIESKKASDLKIINFLIENLNNNFYQNEKMILRERVKTVKVEHIFESALAKTNKNLAEFLRAEKIKFNPRTLNATAGVVFEDSLHFANIGKNKAFLIYKNQQPQNKNGLPRKKTAAQGEEEKNNKNYCLTDIIKYSEKNEKKTPINAAKLFSNVVSGRIPKNGYFVFSNEALGEYFSSRQIIETVTTLPPAGAAEQIKNSLSKINYFVSFLCLIIKNTAEREEETTVKNYARETSAPESVLKLNKTEDETERLLTPGGLVNFKKWLKLPALFSAGIFKFSRNKSAGKGYGAATLKDKIFFGRKTSFQFIKKSFSLLKNIFLYIFNVLLSAVKFLSDKEKMLAVLEKIKSAPANIKLKALGLFSWFKNLGMKNKILFAIAIISLLLLGQNLIFSGLKNNKIEKERVFLDLTAAIEQKQNQVEASLLYGNGDNAREIFSEIKNLMSALPRETDEQIAQYENFQKKYSEQAEKIQHVVKIENPKELANFSNLSPNASAANIILAPNGKIYAADAGQKSIYTIDLSNNLITAIPNLSADIVRLDYPSLSQENIFYFNPEASGSSAIQLELKTESINISPIVFANDAKNISAVSVYNGKIYLLNSTEGQIYKLDKSATGFTSGAKWLNNNADFANASGMSIDGNIYVLKTNGMVIKLSKGNEEEFKLNAIDPAFTEAKKIIVSPEKDFIYILEPAQNRLAIFSKTSGNFIMQYRSDQFTDLKDFAVDEKNKKIYFLNNNSVYETEGKHF